MRFDDQAEKYDKRAGLPLGTPAKIAATLYSMAGLNPNDRVFEIGVGTGIIGLELARLAVHYSGIDVSIPMLEVFRSHVATAGVQATLLHSDGETQWPMNSGSISLVFGSRSLHLVNARHVASEMKRVARREGAFLIIGGIKRDDSSVKEIIRRQMRQLLLELGYEGRGDKRVGKALRSEMAIYNAIELEPRIADTWSVHSTPEQSLISWEGKTGLAGLELPDSIKQEVMHKLRKWATEFFGSLQFDLESKEHYVLQGMEIHP